MSDREQVPLHGANNSGLNRLRLRLEKSTPSLTRKVSSNLQEQPRKTSIFTLPSSMNLHRRQRSVDELITGANQLNISKPRSRSVSPKKVKSNYKYNFNNTNSINEAPQITNVSNFSSPSKSLLSDSSDGFSPLIEPQNSSNSIPKIDITEPQSPPPLTTHVIKEPSPTKPINSTTFGRFRRKTLSMFFDQGPSNMTRLTPISPTDQPFESQSIERPKLSKSHSENDRDKSNEKDVKEAATTLRLQQDLTRKRSKTMGSVENDLYHKRNGSIVKTIGSMMMLRPKPQNYDSSASISQTSLSIDSDPLNVSAPPSPPPMQDDEDPKHYIRALKDEGFDFEITSILSGSDAPKLKECLNCFMEERFDFHEVPLDIALRMFLMFCELPPEAQQIDRVLESFSVRYYQCNVSLWDNSDQVYFITFSLVMLHTDYYNTNNKKKMTREDFVRNTRVDGNVSTSNSFLTKEILEYFYDNTIYTKFVKKYQLAPQHSPQNLYTLPRRLFSSSSSHNLENLNQNSVALSSPNLRSQSFSSTTSQIFSSAPVIDPYQMILSNQIEILKLDVNSINFQNPFKQDSQEEVNYDDLDAENITNVREELLSNKGLYIRYNKDCNWLTSKTEIKFKSDEEVEYGKRVLLKVIKVSEIYRQETVTNSKFFTIGSTSRVIWRKYFGLLTTCGFFLFDTLNFLSVPERQKIFSGDYGDEPFIVDILLDFILRYTEKYSLNGLFASPLNSIEDFTFDIYSTNKKETFSTSSFEGLSSWISSINYIAALDSCFIDKIVSNNHEVSPLRTITMEEKILKLDNNKNASLVKVHNHLKIIQHIKTLAPFSHKTRENLIHHFKSLSIKIDWLWYEIERNLVYTEILRRELSVDDTYSMRTEEESLLEDSFINDEYYRSRKKQINQGYSTRAPLTLVNDSSYNLDEDYDSEDDFVDARG
ncbi:ARF guanine-nucleotide exchange factor 1 [Wickerhamomyces ciferrii]|uniref:ARF guanine-nucleotide exchange factor 1 n=1 Tax=Wickerhamomyces ciferrii (strain ATCC 14091 / BCRC 22168 / CBS 111 / JCM 3599 / NBRC 0793 / NRRL Y-1031 F-60-10) TaxID=1206466 RepID=K0KS77_WICCF|nr:ARF guanine-nucleotide exchange factor 1 [Wickerhamomyces ciferrii]CCH46016.1 ARF guanine-nucleotide exchange factor 1 [Wickerhamomyces ciferrii]